jgi:CCR4-NOT transcriptional regulation complex NOT5 subunit
MKRFKSTNHKVAKRQFLFSRLHREIKKLNLREKIKNNVSDKFL